MSTPRPTPRPKPNTRLGGIIHTYQKYDPGSFPSPTAPPPDVASAAMDHMLTYGSTSRLTPEQLANAIKLDPSQIAGLGPSLDSLIKMLEERKRKILETYETRAALDLADRAFITEAGKTDPSERDKIQFDDAVRMRQLRDLERLWYTQRDDHAPFSKAILRTRDRLTDLVQIEQLDSKYDFTGRTKMDVPKALEIKEELETIDRLLEQMRDAMENAQVALIDMNELAQFASEADLEGLRELQQQVEEFIRQQAEMQGLEQDGDGFRLTPKAYRLFQGALLREVFASLEAARSGRHEGPNTTEGVVEIPKTRPYEFGDAPSQMDIPQTLINAMLRHASSGEPGKARITTDDIEVHYARNNPKCATSVLMDMSGSMRHGGQYVNAKRMAIALHGLIQSEYPGDHLSIFELFSLAKQRHVSELPELMPKPVTIRDPIVRLRADLADPDITESLIPPHFTNIQHGLRLARQTLGAQDTPNRQVFLITDGLPTAHFEGSSLYLLYPPDPATESATMREAMLCQREGITINIFLIPSWSQSEEDIQFAHRMAETTGGRVFFTAGDDLDRFVLWDYVTHRRKIIG